jgi:hypothetical protein
VYLADSLETGRLGALTPELQGLLLIGLVGVNTAYLAAKSAGTIAAFLSKLAK